MRDLGTERLPWDDLLVIVQHAPRTTALWAAIHGPDSAWGLLEQLVAAAVDALNGANWQRGNGKQRDKPKPIQRPGIKFPETTGKQPISMDEMADWLGWSKELATPEPVVSVDKLTPPPRKRDARGRFTK